MELMSKICWPSRRWLAALTVLVTTAMGSVAIAGVPPDWLQTPPFLVQPADTTQPQMQPVKPETVVADTAIEEIATFPYREQDPTFASYGFNVGDVGPDVPLVRLDGSQINLRDTTSTTRPTLVVTVSLTCPIARNQLDDAERVAQEYAESLDVRLVYVVEAHPIVDPSPYTGEEWIARQNTTDGIEYRQPTTMGERIALAEELQRRHDISIPMLVDGPSNSWWQTYGPAPNQAVLLAADGTVLMEHGWFDGDDLDIDADLSRLLAL